MTDQFQSKLDDLEALIAHQAREISDLNDVVVAQANEIDALKKYVKLKLDKLQNNLQDISETEHKSVNDEAMANKPPHY